MVARRGRRTRRPQAESMRGWRWAWHAKRAEGTCYFAIIVKTKLSITTQIVLIEGFICHEVFIE